MEAQNLISVFCIKTLADAAPLITIKTTSIVPSTNFCKFPVRYDNWTSPKFLASHRLNFTQQIECMRKSVYIICDKAYIKSKLKRKKLVVFVSGSGSNFRSIHEACVGGSVHGHIVVFVTNKSCCGGAEYARSKGIPDLLFPKGKNDFDGLSLSNLVTALGEYEVDFILLAGYQRQIPGELNKAYPRSIVNIHTSLLPAFGGKGYYGMKVHKAVIASGARYSGPTIHFVDENYDEGRILAQRVVPVLANDFAEDLAARVLHEKHKLYVEVTAALCEERIVWRENGVPLVRSKQNPDKYSYKI